MASHTGPVPTDMISDELFPPIDLSIYQQQQVLITMSGTRTGFCGTTSGSVQLSVKVQCLTNSIRSDLIKSEGVQSGPGRVTAGCQTDGQTDSVIVEASQ